MIAVNKSAVDAEKSAFDKTNYNEPTKDNIIKVYNEIESSQVFGTGEIEDILGCSASTARAVMAKLREMEVVVSVKGKGKGKYMFVDGK